MSNNNRKKASPDQLKESGLTYNDYAAIDDGNTYELVDGHLELMSPAPTIIHQLVSGELFKKFSQSCESDYIILPAPVDVILAPTEVRQPDLAIVHRNRLDILSQRAVEGAPDLVVEILSPGTLKRDKIDKLRTYAKYGIPEYWIVDPEAGVLEEYVLDKERYELNNIFQEEEMVNSPNIRCISFTMTQIMAKIPRLT
ncbi:Uma2 family endonuclease [Siminovitchia sp. 179-K 8D1 HS]|uniref:Uma2 family endonuclease n=1 Tax=Siminovitchia sp. 179-K 8D1 HS TaxID=3142385 RepID=UPI0039A1C98A